MVKTEVQIPDDLYQKAKQLAVEEQCSFAEVVCRGLKHITKEAHSIPIEGFQWEPPPPHDLGETLLPESQWTEASHE